LANIITRPDWQLPERLVTPEGDYRNRRVFLKQLGLTGAGLSLGTACRSPKLYPDKRNPLYNPNPEKSLAMTPEKWATGYNCFYEFTTKKTLVRHPNFIGKFKTDPWPLVIDGLVGKPWRGDARDLIAEMGKADAVEERVYRFRCVEGWGMVVPWTGFELGRLIKKVQPHPEAKFVKFTSFHDPDNAPGLAELPGEYKFPYTEGLWLDEARHPLTMLATGLYGKPLPKQNGAPLRLVVPWKYGYKDIKSIVRIEFTDREPKTLWGQVAPSEHSFESNVDPAVPHPRWSQQFERQLGLDGRVPTLKYNGYGKQVAALYK
jgi:sulfoxide reductase catalytic subunit YedY